MSCQKRLTDLDVQMSASLVAGKLKVTQHFGISTPVEAPPGLQGKSAATEDEVRDLLEARFP